MGLGTISFDSETTGRDFFHGAKPYFVTFALPDGSQPHCEWKVNPYTREPEVDTSDIQSINDLLSSADEIVGQNVKFDATALDRVGANPLPWEKVHDTLMAAHLLASNRPKDLTTLSTIYLGRSIQKYEDELEKATLQCRAFAKKHMPKWRIARYGLSDMPSLKKSAKDKDGKVWKPDCWLLQAVADHLGYARTHPYRTLLRDYANEDSATTLAIWVVMKDELRRRGLWEIYECRRKLLPIIFDMEKRGVVLSKKRLDEIYKQYSRESEEKLSVCLNIAESEGFGLDMPRGSAVNESLRFFCFDVLQLPQVKNPKAKTDAPCLDTKNAIPFYLDTLPPRSKARKFITSLVDKRSCDGAVGFMEQYLKFGVPDESLGEDWLILHPSINPTGTDTLRFSFSNPNSGNVSTQETDCKECEGEGCELCDGTGKSRRSPRYCFGPGPGREWWKFDGENLELRIPGYESEEQELINLFEKPNDPPYYGSEHLLNFSTVYPDIWDNAVAKVGIDKAGPWIKKNELQWYKRCKNGDFAVGYGAIDRSDMMGTADRAFGRPGSHARLKARFARKEALNQKYIQFAEKYGYVETLPDRTVNPKHGYPLLCTRSDWGQILPTVPLNYHVQGSAMWWTIKAMIRVWNFLEGLNRGELFQGRQWPGGYYIALQVHDELDLDMPSGRGKAPKPYTYNLPIAREVKRLMEMGGQDFIPSIPIPVGVEFCEHNWSESINATDVLNKPMPSSIVQQQPSAGLNHRPRSIPAGHLVG